MAKVNIAKIAILDNPAKFTDPFKFEITFECYEPLADDLEWRLVYVTCTDGSSRTEDIELDSVCVGPLPEGRHKFVFEASPPPVSRLQPSEIVGVTVILLTCGYLEQEFVKVGYYVASEYEDPEMNENPPETPKIDLLRRRVVDEPRVTRLPIKWHREPPPEQVAATADDAIDNSAAGATANNQEESLTAVDAAPPQQEQPQQATCAAMETDGAVAQQSAPLQDVTNNTDGVASA